MLLRSVIYVTIVLILHGSVCLLMFWFSTVVKTNFDSRREKSLATLNDEAQHQLSPRQFNNKFFPEFSDR